MKKILIPLFFILAFNANAQFLSFGVRAGVGTPLTAKELILANPTSGDQLLILLKNKSFGYHIALLTRAKIGPLFVQPEIAFNSNRYDMSWQNISNLQTNIPNQKFDYIDAPILAGLKLGLFRINAGPVAHFLLSDVYGTINQYTFDFSKISIAYVAGVGLDLGPAMIDVRYDGNLLSKNPIDLLNQFQISQRPNKLSASIGIKF